MDATGWLTAYLILLFFIPSRLIIGPLGSAGALSMLFGLGSLFLWSLFLLSPRRRLSTQVQPIRVALGLFLFSVGVSYVLAMSGPLSPDEVSPSDVALLALASWSGTLLLAHDGVFQRRQLDLLIWRFTVCGGLISALGLVQIATRRLWVDQLAIPGLSSAPAYGLVTRGGFPRPSGTAIHPIEFGVLLAMMVPIALHVGFFHTHRPAWMRWLPAVALAAVIPVTSSRSAYLGAILALLVCMLGWSRPRRLVVAGFGACGLLAMAVLTPNFFDSVLRLFTGADEDPSITSRTDSFSIAFEFVSRKPWFGRGLGTFLPKYRIFDNEYLLLLVGVGLVGTLAFLVVGITTISTLARMRRRARDETTRDLAVALLASVLAGFSCLFMFDAFAFPMAMGCLFLVLGVSGALGRLETSDALVAVPRGGVAS